MYRLTLVGSHHITGLLPHSFRITPTKLSRTVFENLWEGKRQGEIFKNLTLSQREIFQKTPSSFFATATDFRKGKTDFLIRSRVGDNHL